MGSLVQWKFLIDLALIGALGFLCFRFMRSPRSDGELRKVEGLLRELIQDAEQASRSLDSQLLRRRESLEQTLFELETVESRVSRTLSHAEQQRGELSGLMGSLTKIVSQQQHTDHSLDDSADSSPVKASVAENPMFDQPPEPPSFTSNQSTTSAPTRKLNFVDQETIKTLEAGAPKWSEVNIFGEPIGKSLNEQIEVVEESSTQNERSADPGEYDSLEKMYDAAEQMLRTGRALEQVVAATQLPLTEVKLLQNMINQESLAQETLENSLRTDGGPTDGRLGVLGPVKRQVQTV